MSNINNHGVDMNKIELSPHLQELTCEQATAIQGGAEIVVFTDSNFSGNALKVVNVNSGDQLEFTNEFNNSISSAKVLSGKWELATNSDGSGSLLILEPGDYPDFSTIFNGVFNDTISLAKTNIA